MTNLDKLKPIDQNLITVFTIIDWIRQSNISPPYRLSNNKEYNSFGFRRS